MKIANSWSGQSELPRQNLVLSINLAILKALQNVEIVQEEESPEDCGNSKGSFLPFFPEVFVLADKTKQSKLNILDLREFITAEIASNKCHIAAATVGKLKTLFSYDTGGYR